MNQDLQIVSSQTNASSTLLPLPELNLNIRPAVMSDIPFIDSLQKLHTKQVGWMPTATFEGKIRAGHVLVAESDEATQRLSDEGGEGSSASFPSVAPSLRRSVAYLIASDQYFKRDDVGVIYQMNVLPGRQRGLIGASLLKAQFERSAYGCKLYCCWCAQDIAANKFWEAMGFVPLAFRAGSEKRARVHIFWQKRIRAGDTTTPWWFPAKTAGGSLREDRIVLPIPHGTHWSDAKPMILPAEVGSEQLAVGSDAKKLPGPRRTKSALPTANCPPPTTPRRNGLAFGIPQPGEAVPVIKSAKVEKPKAEKIKRKCDPRLVSAARELRDRWLEQVNEQRMIDCAKYDVSRLIDDGRSRIAVAGPIKQIAA